MSTRVPLLVSIDDVGKLLGVRRTTVMKLLYGGALPSVTIGRRRLVIHADVLAYVEQRRSADGAIATGAR
jgi:excisionase family DNA binding protein